MLDPHPDLTSGVIHGLGYLYALLFCMNAYWAVRSFKLGYHFRLPKSLGGQDVPSAGPWAMYAVLLLLVALAHFVSAGRPDAFLIRLPGWLQDLVNVFADPISYFALSTVLFVAMIWLREWWVKPTAAWVLLNITLVSMGLAITDYDFRQIVGKPDNVPIVGMLFIVAFFTWIYFKRANDNDKRIAEGRPLFEQENNEKVLVWPDLVYAELICMVLITVVLVAWGIVLEAPLEEAANAAKTPNPSKAPWYFLGLQEMLVYYDPWLAGVVFPSVILVGLMAIPYIDFNKRGSGYYSFNERKFAVITFLFGFLPLWVAMIILGTFLRGPNWNFFGIFEYWDTHKLAVLDNVNLSDLFWTSMLGQALPGNMFLRELPGILLVLGYFAILPGLMAATVFRKFFHRMGFIRFVVFSNLVLLMVALPLKMVLRWTFNLKYIVAIPEYFFNI
ncbi:MAG: hypothetical protein HOL01_15445 [Planctomycetaceae bacterium]|jgi:hypothetical protein|nr:hypothetical protein [Planctomycetaceae bacterium]MBT6485127.1 hypothetical protein [Planctomycetaceae bacterium]MBT6495940.1 hypothetical protein [Planctomycetaceae bacterium]